MDDSITGGPRASSSVGLALDETAGTCGAQAGEASGAQAGADGAQAGEASGAQTGDGCAPPSERLIVKATGGGELFMSLQETLAWGAPVEGDDTCVKRIEVKKREYQLRPKDHPPTSVTMPHAYVGDCTSIKFPGLQPVNCTIRVNSDQSGKSLGEFVFAEMGPRMQATCKLSSGSDHILRLGRVDRIDFVFPKEFELPQKMAVEWTTSDAETHSGVIYTNVSELCTLPSFTQVLVLETNSHAAEGVLLIDGVEAAAIRGKETVVHFGGTAKYGIPGTAKFTVAQVAFASREHRLVASRAYHTALYLKPVLGCSTFAAIGAP